VVLDVFVKKGFFWNDRSREWMPLVLLVFYFVLVLVLSETVLVLEETCCGCFLNSSQIFDFQLP
jgi:hypothetical protein